jgi:hypothetical protein
MGKVRGMALGHGENQGHSRHHARQGAHDDRKKNVPHSSDSVLANHVLQKEWFMEHVNTQIYQVVVMYRSAEKVIRPPAPPDVSVCKDIMSFFSFLFLGVTRHYVKRPFSCWCTVCSRVRERGLGSQSSGPDLLVKVVRVLNRPFGHKTSLQSHHQQGFGIVRKG